MMINSMVTKIRGMSAFVAVASGLALASASVPASAAVTGISGTCTDVEYTTGQLLIQLNTANGVVNYVAATTPPSNCSSYARPLDTQKMFMSLAQAALLSGKTMVIYYTNCNTVNYITTVDITT